MYSINTKKINLNFALHGSFHNHMQPNRSLRSIEGYTTPTSTTLTPAPINCTNLKPSCYYREDEFKVSIGNYCYPSEYISGGTPKPNSKKRLAQCPSINGDACLLNKLNFTCTSIVTNF